MLVGALLGIATNYATDDTDTAPWGLRVLREWSVPLIVLALVLLVAGQVWLHLLERPAAIRRKWNAAQPPYPGLEAFTEDDAGVFFGRDPEIRDLVGRLHPSVPARAHRFVGVIGPSGSGKSSLVLAGLLPALRRRRGHWEIVPPCAPGTDPLTSLASSLAATRMDMTVEQVRAELAGGAVGLRRCTDRLRAMRGGRAVPLLLVIDQLEEIFTLSGEQERETFLSLIRDAIAADPLLWVVATLRSDFLTDFLESGHAELVRQPTLVGVLGRPELLQVIEKPAACAGMAFAPGVTAVMVDDAGGGDALPLLAYTLQELYLRVGAGGTVTSEDYRSLGGVAGTLSEQANRITAELRASDGDAPVLTTLLKFVTLEHGEPTRRRVERGHLTERERAVAEAFVVGRLLTGADGVLDVAHEALFRQWPPLRQAVAARTEELRHRTELERWARDWERSARQEAYLLNGERLRVARQWVDEADGSLADVPLVAEFLESSARLDRASLERLADAVAVRVMEIATSDPELAILGALAALEECAPTSAAQQALHTALNASRVRAVLRGHGQDINAVTWSPDGARLATGSDDGTIRVWNTERSADPVVLTPGGGGHRVQSVAWSPDGKHLASGSRDGTATVWDVETGTEAGLLTGHDEAIESIVWASDGERLATASGDRTVRLWDVANLVEVARFTGHERTVWDVAWSPDGRKLASASDDGTVRVWSSASGREVAVLARHRAGVSAVAWSPDGRLLASVSEDRMVFVSAVAEAEAPPGTPGTGALRRQLECREKLSCVAWSPDGRRLAVGDEVRTALIWDLDTDEQTLLPGHTDSINGIAWNGSRIATVSRDRTVAVWDSTAPGGQSSTLLGHKGSVVNVSWAPCGTRLATASQDGTAVVWDVDRGSAVASLSHAGDVSDAAWSPDSTRLVTVSQGGAATVWNVGDGTELLLLRGHRDEITSAAWSPDGTRIATTSRDRTARLWNVVDGAELMVLQGRDQWLGGAAWSPDSRHLATSLTDRALCVWDLEAGTLATTLHGHTDYVWSIAWSPEGQRLATGSRDNTVRIWDPFTGTELHTMTGHRERVQGVAWSPDGACLATASWDRTIRLWNPADGQELKVIGVHDDQVNGLAWHPDGSLLATVSRDRTVRIWDPSTDLDTLLGSARTRVFRQLTGDERQGFLLPSR
ncbi:WD40 repeat domain-containing protein [Streptomyces caniscabiei]|uniref:WD40 repeat domain-containing protein n=1 Tax=Streptomyces caniscabiei TaxID=2746961 RepID=A0ABU4MZ62_9ACTN|nr:WD40 repeat domain-containing protein [Streptomyces caniscabiei]MDX2948172.1 WD40 repeat domain-containing protein [Streptomyces caniscabiei]MDX2955899.1 WD40 repeat domain-containing protein [Streptomyces caniscabiei]MDX2989764.1 WD40 repeat domain-containing protein [Streptomyces caniscabiei]MDX3013649.1 WD40 repeat domain-containing protein [Streptomyces caniscabiei]MDX3042796.1 WD40 repeat domain-containing protein [Streptomyces caniscabiei]